MLFSTYTTNVLQMKDFQNFVRLTLLNVLFLLYTVFY